MADTKIDYSGIVTKTKKTFEKKNHGDIIGHTNFKVEMSPAGLKQTRPYTIKINYPPPSTRTAKPFHKKVGYPEKEEPKPRASVKILTTSTSSAVPIGDGTTASAPRHSRIQRKRVTDNGLSSPILQNSERHIAESNAATTQRNEALKKKIMRRPKDHDAHFVYDPSTSAQFVNPKKLGRRSMESRNVSTVFTPRPANDSASALAAPINVNITKSSAKHNIMKWDESIDSARPLKKEMLSPARLGNILGFDGSK